VNFGTFSVADNSSGSLGFSDNTILDLSQSTLVNTASLSLSLGANSLLIVPASFSPSTALAGYSNLGLTHTAGTTLNLLPGQQVNGAGNIADFVNCQGSIAADGGSINVSGGVSVTGTGSVNLSGGAYTVDDALSGIVSGSLTAANGYVGNSGSGTFTQSGGTNSSNSLYLGFAANSSGIYNLSGAAVLSAISEYVGSSGCGTMTQTGGSNTVAVLLQIGGSGTYNLQGGILSVPSIQGSGTLNLDGGTLAASGPISTSLPVLLEGDVGAGIINTEGYTVTMSGPITGSGELFEMGSGTLVLSGSNSYTGGTTVASGTLILDGANSLLNGTSLTIGSGGLFDGPVIAASAAPLAITAVPEPGTWALLTVGLLFAAGRSCRKMRAAQSARSSD
jgi:autotransporter-associated beta strand protein